MQLKARIEVSIKVRENESPDSARDRVIEKLVEVIDDWIDGGIAIPIKYEYTMKEEETTLDRKYLN